MNGGRRARRMPVADSSLSDEGHLQRTVGFECSIIQTRTVTGRTLLTTEPSADDQAFNSTYRLGHFPSIPRTHRRVSLARTEARRRKGKRMHKPFYDQDSRLQPLTPAQHVGEQ
jgi:hypothetical protein